MTPKDLIEQRRPYVEKSAVTTRLLETAVQGASRGRRHGTAQPEIRKVPVLKVRILWERPGTRCGHRFDPGFCTPLLAT